MNNSNTLNVTPHILSMMQDYLASDLIEIAPFKEGILLPPALAGQTKGIIIAAKGNKRYAIIEIESAWLDDEY